MIGRRRAASRCGWAGIHSGDVVTVVETNTECGHNPHKVETCEGHLDVLLSQSGRAPRPSACPTCGVPSFGRVVDTADID